MKLGLVGYPQAGKKTLFKLLTSQTPSANGSSRNGSIGLAQVLDDRFDRLVDLYRPVKKTPALMEFVLLPDLDLDATRNAEALKALEEVDVICHLVRAFADEGVYHIAGSVDPARDIRTFTEEMQLSDLIFLEKRLERLAREQRTGKNDQAVIETAMLQRMRVHLEEGQPLRTFPFTNDEIRSISSYPLLTRKTVINAINVDEDQIGGSGDTFPIERDFTGEEYQWIAVSARIEEELAQLEPADRQAFLDHLNLEQPALQRLTQLCYRALGLISFFTVGQDEVRAWTIRSGAHAPQAGRVIHSDIERGFIRAEVMKFRDLIELGSEPRVKDAGKLLPKGRDYTVEDGDILHFLFKV